MEWEKRHSNEDIIHVALRVDVQASSVCVCVCEEVQDSICHSIWRHMHRLSLVHCKLCTACDYSVQIIEIDSG